MSPLQLADSGILFINPEPAYRHVSAFFPNVVQLGEREFICVYQRGDGMYAANCELARLRSRDGGQTWQDEGPLHERSAGREWETPEPAEIPGQTNCVAELPDGRLAAIYTLRDSDQPGFLAVLSHDGGRSWDVENQLRLWDATGWTEIGVSSPDRFPRSHDTIAFGAPSLIATSGGELLASWWCTYASLTHLRWARITA